MPCSVPDSRLVLKNKPFACEVARVHFLQQLVAHGVESWRVDLLPLAAANADHLGTYALMDISLDPFPYAGEKGKGGQGVGGVGWGFGGFWRLARVTGCRATGGYSKPCGN
jgi:hypothetical protein